MEPFNGTEGDSSKLLPIDQNNFHNGMNELKAKAEGIEEEMKEMYLYFVNFYEKSKLKITLFLTLVSNEPGC